MSLSFLKNITLASNEEVKPSFAVKSAKAPVDRLPSGLAIRLFKNGAIYPSAELVERFNLEYTGKDSEIQNFGLDILSSKVFPNTVSLPEAFIIVAVVPKNLPKIDVFGSTKFVSEEEVTADPSLILGAPKSSVLEQGSSTFGKEVLLPMLTEVYGYSFDEDQKFVDLVVYTDSPLVTDDGNYFIPKPITRGEKKGQLDVVVRKDIAMFPLVLATSLSEDLTEEKTEDKEPVKAPEAPKVEEEISVEEANVPEIDLTAKTKGKAAATKTSTTIEPSIEEVLDSEEELAIGIDVAPLEQEEISIDSEEVEVAPEDDEEFGDISI